MTAIKKLPDKTTLLRLRQAGMTLTDIAEEYEVTPSAVWRALERAGVTEPVATLKDLLPWEISPEHKMVAIMKNFRMLNRQRQGLEIDPASQRLLEEWLKGLSDNGVVVNYHPDAPANVASRKGGFYYVKREPRDKWIIREPEA